MKFEVKIDLFLMKFLSKEAERALSRLREAASPPLYYRLIHRLHSVDIYLILYNN